MNAAVAATEPIKVTRSAPDHTFCPVTFALKKPKKNRQMTVKTQDHLKPSRGVSVKKYGDKGISPPAT